MSQTNLETTTGGGAIMPDDTSGVELASILNNWRDAIHTSHSGATAPTYRKVGMHWLDTGNAAMWYLRLCRVVAALPANDVWAALLAVNTATGAVTPCTAAGVAIPIAAAGASSLLLTDANGQLPLAAMPSSLASAASGSSSRVVSAFPVNDSGQSGRSYYHMVFLMADGSLRGCGRNYVGALGMGNIDQYYSYPELIPLPVGAKATKPKQVYIDSHATTVLMEDGSVWTTGYYGQGQAGQGNANHNYSLVKVPLPSTCKKVAVSSAYGADYRTYLYLLDNGQCYAAGYNGYGQCGVGNTTNQPTPALVIASGDWSDVGTSGSQYTSCWAIKANGTAVVWGCNAYGQLGLGDVIDRTAPTALPTATGIKKITMSNMTSYSCTYVLTIAGTVYAAGYNANGQLGLGTTTQTNALTLIPALTGVADIAADGAGWGFVYALLTNGTLKCWGYNPSGALARGDLLRQVSPVTPTAFLQAGETVKKVVVACWYSRAVVYVLTSNNRVLSCGNNTYGQLGRGISTQYPTGYNVFTEIAVLPTKDITITDIFINGYGRTDVDYSSHSVYLLTNTGQVLSCGSGDFGQLGRGQYALNHGYAFGLVKF